MLPTSFKNFFRWLYRNRSIRLTTEGTRFVLLVFAIGLAAINTGNNLLYLLLAMMLSLIVLSGILSERSLKHLSIHRQVPQHIFAGNPATAYFTIMNKKARHPSFSLRFMDIIKDQTYDCGIHLLHLGPGRSILQPYTLGFPRRGLVTIQAVKILTRFPFSLFIKGLTVPLESEVVVYPAIKPIPPSLDTNLKTIGYDHSIPRRGIGGDLYNLRLYQPGDDSRTIHWRTTARTNILIVRETEAEEQQEVFLALPTIKPLSAPAQPETEASEDDRFERAVTLTASLATWYHRRGFAVQALVGNTYIPAGSDEAHLYTILRILALCQAQPGTDSVTDTEGPSNLARMSQGGIFTLLILPWSDPAFEGAFSGMGKVLRIWEILDTVQ